ncbi:hypothetical protein K488DRAFT_56022 [Vararia minispora EC-137]|uniref:Uncharacterized protein n=1 Tax=Vararia minispora EC-137 TaxID=1314806 RepID=A0ACB8QD14_9AGAM|nr:hypothetical protein K488DRAFT_56022 [Vararia minispora EC-137]
MRVPRSLGDFFNDGELKSGQIESNIVNNGEVRRVIQSGTERNYKRAVALFDVYVNRNPLCNLDSFKTPKDFIRKVAYAIKGRCGDPKACLKTVHQYWKNLTAGWRRVGRYDIRDQVFIFGDLQKEMKLAYQKRARRYGTMLHFVYLGTQLWKYDWHRYDRPRGRLYLWDGIVLNVFTSARVGEFIESTAREGSGRGLHYRDVSFVFFRNEDGNAEFAMEIVKDAKGMTASPGRRSEHALHEGSGQHPLFCNPMLTRVAILLAKGASRDFKTMDELLDFEPGEDGITRIAWNPRILDEPVYKRGDGHIWSARTYSDRLHPLGLRSEFRSINNHDFRAEGIRSIDENYSSSQRRRHAGHGSDSVYDEYYAPRNPGTDGQGAYAGDTPRTLFPKLLRILKMDHNPVLAQSLPARELHELATSDAYSNITDKLDELDNFPGSDDASAKKRRAELLSDLRKLKLEALQQYQEQQIINPLAKMVKTEDERHYRTPFSRIRRLMPIRSRLAEDLFSVTSIRSPAGRAVLRDLIELYQSDFEVRHRPGLEPERCHCSKHPKAVE